MYKTLKKLAKKIIPQKFLFENEVLLRSIIYPIYKGETCQCNICDKKLKEFILVENGNLVCPVCGSLGRTRRLWDILNREFLKPNIKILDFSPSRAIYRSLKNNNSVEYFPSDFENEFLADYNYDITNINAKSDEFDLIICYHILEHIENDKQAISELYRVLKPNATCIIQTPFKEGEIYEDFSIKSKEERVKHFGQDDHVRIYSVNGLTERLIDAGFEVDVRTYDENDYYKMSQNESILICKKK